MPYLRIGIQITTSDREYQSLLEKAGKELIHEVGGDGGLALALAMEREPASIPAELRDGHLIFPGTVCRNKSLDHSVVVPSMYFDDDCPPQNQGWRRRWIALHMISSGAFFLDDGQVWLP